MLWSCEVNCPLPSTCLATLLCAPTHGWAGVGVRSRAEVCVCFKLRIPGSSSALVVFQSLCKGFGTRQGRLNADPMWPGHGDCFPDSGPGSDKWCSTFNVCGQVCGEQGAGACIQAKLVVVVGLWARRRVKGQLRSGGQWLCFEQ